MCVLYQQSTQLTPLRLNPSSGTPLYLQRLEHLKHSIETGALRAGEQLPSVRKMAEDLVINPNTVVRADRDLEREAIVVLSDGDDTSSLVAYEEVLDLAKRSETAIYAIGLKQNDGGRRDFKEAEFVLKQLSQETGGRAFYPGSVAELPKIYELIAQELSSQYAIGYVSKNTARNGSWRKLSVRVNRPGLIGRTRQGYYAPTARR